MCSRTVYPEVGPSDRRLAGGGRYPRPVTRRALALVVGLVALAGCGGDDGAQPGDPLGEALSYVHEGAPLVAAIATDPERGQLRATAGIVGDVVLYRQVRRALDRIGLDLERVRPLLGNDVVVSTGADPSRMRDVVGAWVAKNDDGLRDAIEEAGLAGAGRIGDRDVFRARGGGLVALKGPVLVFAGDSAGLRLALRRHDLPSGLTRDELRPRLQGLPGDALIRAVGDGAVLARRFVGRGATQVPWLTALEDVALSVKAADGGFQIGLRAQVDDEILAPSDVPLAVGPDSPRPAGENGVVVGVRDLAHTIEWLERYGPAVGFKTLSEFQPLRDALRRFARFDLDGLLLTRLSETTTITSDGEDWTFRAEVDDAEPLEDALPRLRTITALAGGVADLQGYSLAEPQQDRYVLSRDGEPLLAFGLAGDVLVASTNPKIDIGAVAKREPSSGGSRGALTGRLSGASLARVVTEALDLRPGAAIALGALGDTDFAVHAELDRLRAEAFLAVAR